MLSLEKLSPAELAHKFEVSNSYARFWDTVKKNKGWVKSDVTYDQVAGYLDTAAEIVTRVRSLMDKEQPDKPHRLKEGSAVEYLWLLDHYPDDDSVRFIKGLVHSTFRDAKGYVEGLYEDDLNKWIDQFLSWKQKQKAERLAAVAKEEEELMNEYHNLASILGELFGPPHDEEWKQSLSHASGIESVLKSLRSTALMAHAHKKKMQNEKERGEESRKRKRIIKEGAADVPTTIEEKVEEETVRSSEGKTKEKEETGKEIPLDTKEEGEGEKQEEVIITDLNEEEEEEEEKEEEDIQPDETSLLEIKRLGGEVAHLEDVIHHLTKETADLSIDNLTATPDEASKIIEKLQHDCIKSTDLLMKDLFRLDSIVGSPEIRPQRKAQVGKIQELLTDVDSIKSKLHNYLVEINKAKKEIETKAKETKAEGEPMDKGKESESKEEVEKMEGQKEEEEEEEDHLPAESDGESVWAKIELTPQFNITQSGTAFQISAFIPGMKEEDITISLSEDERILTIAGKRLPTKEDIKQMEMILAEKSGASDPHGLYRSALRRSKGDTSKALLLTGQGRFGSFEEKFRLPPGASIDLDNLQASYDRGVLRVSIPRKRRPTGLQTYTSPYARYSNPIFGGSGFPFM